MVLGFVPRAVTRLPASIRLFDLPARSALSTNARMYPRRSLPLALSVYNPTRSALVRYASGGQHLPAYPPIDYAREEKYANRVLRAHPERVSKESTTHPIFHEIVARPEAPEPDMMAGVRSDLKVFKETFSLHEVPRDALYLGLAGVIPYLATSISTVYMAWDLNHSAAHGTGVFFDAQSAAQFLAILEPLQIGYGAVIISFLGAIHWGLEWAGYGGRHDRRRYAVGLLAPVLAWPTVLMPFEYALITQFLAFNYLYFQDANASTRGTAPPWYSIFRFVLTFIVGASIVVTLIGQGQIARYLSHPGRPIDRLQKIRENQMLYLQEEEEEKKRLAAEADAEEDEEEEGEEEEGEGEEEED